MSTPTATPKRVSLAALFGQPETFEQVNVRLPPIRPSATPTVRRANAPDLSKMARVWALIGRGASGKTTLARLLLSHMAERNLIGSTLVAAKPFEQKKALAIGGRPHSTIGARAARCWCPP